MSEDFVSPYVRDAAKRAGGIGSKWPRDDQQYRFQRQQALYIPLEKSEPVRGRWKDWAAGIILFATIAGVIVYSLAV